MKRCRASSTRALRLIDAGALAEHGLARRLALAKQLVVDGTMRRPWRAYAAILLWSSLHGE